MPFRYIALPPKTSEETSSTSASTSEGSEETGSKKAKKPKRPEPLLPPGMIELLIKDNDAAIDLF